MKTPAESLKEGLLEYCEKQNVQHGKSHSYQLGCLLQMVSRLIEGNGSQKTEARSLLKKLTGRGRCILNARDFNAGLQNRPGAAKKEVPNENF